MFGNLVSTPAFQAGLTVYGSISNFLDRCSQKAQDFFKELVEIQYDIKNLSLSTGIIVLLFTSLDILILITVFYYFRRKESYEKINKITIIVAIIMAIVSFIFGYSFYDRPYAKEYSISPYADPKNYALIGLWFGLQGFLFALIICQAITLMKAWLNRPAKKEYNEG